MKPAEAWRLERIGKLQAEIRIEESLLRAARTELAEIKALEGRELELRFGCETPAEVELAMEPKKEFLANVTSIFEEAVWKGTWIIVLISLATTAQLY